MRYRDWYFKDWKSNQQIGPLGKATWTYTYTGRYYLLPDPPRRFKQFCLLSILFHFVFFIILNIIPSQGGRDMQVGGVCLLQIFPLIFFGLATRPLIKSSPKMTYRRYHRIVHRLRWGAALAAILLPVQLVMELRLVVSSGSLRTEIAYISVLLMDILLIFVFAFRILKMKFDTADPDPNFPLPSDE